MTEPICPECAQGKPGNCTGWALDDQDREVECGGAAPISTAQDIEREVAAAYRDHVTAYASETPQDVREVCPHCHAALVAAHDALQRDLARLRAGIEAQHRIEHGDDSDWCVTCIGYEWPCPTVRLLATPDADAQDEGVRRG